MGEKTDEILVGRMLVERACLSYCEQFASNFWSEIQAGSEHVIYLGARGPIRSTWAD